MPERKLTGAVMVVVGNSCWTILVRPSPNFGFMPMPDVGRRARVRPYVVRAVGYALPLLGFRRMGRMLRVAGAALAIWRASRAWRVR